MICYTSYSNNNTLKSRVMIEIWIFLDENGSKYT